MYDSLVAPANPFLLKRFETFGSAAGLPSPLNATASALGLGTATNTTGNSTSAASNTTGSVLASSFQSLLESATALGASSVPTPGNEGRWVLPEDASGLQQVGQLHADLARLEDAMVRKEQHPNQAMLASPMPVVLPQRCALYTRL